MGGVCVALYGFIAVSGLKMIQKVDLNENRNLFVVSVILIAGVGGMTLNFGQVTITSVACALILGILVNVLCSVRKTEGTDAGDADGEAAESGESKSETETSEAPAEEAAVSRRRERRRSGIKTRRSERNLIIAPRKISGAPCRKGGDCK